MVYLSEETIVSKKYNRRRRKNKIRQPQEESVNIINTLRSEYDLLLASPFLTKKEDSGVPMIECTIFTIPYQEDPGVPTVECTIGQRIFHNTFCDIRLGVNIMSKVTYDYFFGNKPLFPIYMVDKTI
jgi:hypothetical protein